MAVTTSVTTMQSFLNASGGNSGAGGGYKLDEYLKRIVEERKCSENVEIRKEAGPGRGKVGRLLLIFEFI